MFIYFGVLVVVCGLVPHDDLYSLAEVYEAMFSWDPETEAEYLDNVFHSFCSVKCKRVLDVGCGTGRVAEGLARLGYSVLGLDVCREMCVYARRVRGLDVVAGDGGLLPFRDCCFDSVYSMLATFNHFDSEEKLFIHLREVCRILRRGGVYVADSVVESPGRVGVCEEWSTAWRGRECRVRWVVESVEDRYYTEILELVCGGSTVFRSRAVLYAPSREEVFELSKRAGFSSVVLLEPFSFKEKRGVGRAFMVFLKK